MHYFVTFWSIFSAHMYDLGYLSNFWATSAYLHYLGYLHYVHYFVTYWAIFSAHIYYLGYICATFCTVWLIFALCG